MADNDHPNSFSCFLDAAWPVIWDAGREIAYDTGETDSVSLLNAAKQCLDAMFQAFLKRYDLPAALIDSLKARNSPSNTIRPEILDFIQSRRWDFRLGTMVPPVGSKNLTPEVMGVFQEQILTPILSKKEIVLREPVPDSYIEFLKGERNKSGTFYTPLEITRHICRAAILPHLFLDESTARYDEKQLGKKLAGIPPGELDAFKTRLESIRLLDPAAGSGDFLLEAARVLNTIWILFQDRNGEPVHTPWEIKGHILTYNLFGADVSGLALKTCRYRLLLWYLADYLGNEEDKELTGLSGLERHLLEGNSLVGRGFEKDQNTGFLTTITKKGQKKHLKLTNPAKLGIKPIHWGENLPEVAMIGGFDVIVGNPPYGRLKQIIEDPALKRELSRLYRALYDHQYGNVNLYKLFLERAYLLLREGGWCSLIFPAPFLGTFSSRKLRKFLFDRVTIHEIVHFPNTSGIFPDVIQALAILSYQRILPDPSNEFRISSCPSAIETDILQNGNRSFHLRRDEWIRLRPDYAVPVFTQPSIEGEILQALAQIPRFAGDGTHRPVGLTGEGHLHETANKEFFSTDPADAILIRRMRIGRYFLDLDGSDKWREAVFLQNREDFLAKKKAALEFLHNHDVIVGKELLQIGEKRRLQFALMPHAYVCGNSARYIVVTDPNLSPYYMLGLLNSSLIEWYFRLFSWTYHVKKYEIENFPIPRAPPEIQRVVGQLASCLLRCRRALNQTGKHATELEAQFRCLDDLLDILVFETYFFPDQKSPLSLAREIGSALPPVSGGKMTTKKDEGYPEEREWGPRDDHFHASLENFLKKDRILTRIREIRTHPWVQHILKVVLK